MMHTGGCYKAYEIRDVGAIKQARRLIAEECSTVIAQLITNELERLDISPSTMDDLYDNIMTIIRGD